VVLPTTPAHPQHGDQRLPRLIVLGHPLQQPLLVRGEANDLLFLHEVRCRMGCKEPKICFTLRPSRMRSIGTASISSRSVLPASESDMREREVLVALLFLNLTVCLLFDFCIGSW